jgi:hypothetical protein
MADASAPFDPNTLNERLIRREALRREALELNTMTPAGLEGALANLSAEVTAEAVERQARTTEPRVETTPARIEGFRPSRP